MTIHTIMGHLIFGFTLLSIAAGGLLIVGALVYGAHRVWLDLLKRSSKTDWHMPVVATCIRFKGGPSDKAVFDAVEQYVTAGIESKSHGPRYLVKLIREIRPDCFHEDGRPKKPYEEVNEVLVRRDGGQSDP